VTVHSWRKFRPLGLTLNEEQIPQSALFFSCLVSAHSIPLGARQVGTLKPGKLPANDTHQDSLVKFSLR